jgi:TolB protein
MFVSDRGGSDDLYIMAADGSGVQQVTRTPAADRSPAWSPDGSSIVFVRERSDSGMLMVMRATCLAEPTTCEEGLTPLAEDRFYTTPAWSPEGMRLAASAAEFPGLPSVIGVFGLAEGDYTPLAGSGGTDITPAWSPDGASIAFAALVEGYDIFMQNPQGGGLTPLVASPANDVEPAWVNGDQLVFASDRGEPGDFDLYLCSLPACGDPQPLTDNAADDLNPAVRP